MGIQWETKKASSNTFFFINFQESPTGFPMENSWWNRQFSSKTSPGRLTFQLFLGHSRGRHQHRRTCFRRCRRCRWSHAAGHGAWRAQAPALLEEAAKAAPWWKNGQMMVGNLGYSIYIHHQQLIFIIRWDIQLIFIINSKKNHHYNQFNQLWLDYSSNIWGNDGTDD